MKKFFLLLIVAVALVSCDPAVIKSNLTTFVVENENALLPLKLQNYSINSPEIMGITIDSVTFIYAASAQLYPCNGYLTTKWKIRKEHNLSDEYSFLFDEYADYEEKVYLIELSDFSDFDAEGYKCKYKSHWPERNPFKP